MRATTQTILLILSVFVFQFSLFLFQIPQQMFTLAYPLLTNPWTIVLNIYAHAGFGHLLSNLIALGVLGLIVERVTTRIRFHIFFILTGVIASISEVTFWMFYSGEVISILGASGAIFALMGYAIVGNNLADSFIGILDLGRVGTIILIMFLGALITYMTASPGVALVAHGSGFVTGAICGRLRLLHVNKEDDSNNYVHEPEMQSKKNDL